MLGYGSANGIRVGMMRVCYDKLGQSMKDNRIKKSDLAKAAEQIRYTMTKLNKERPVSMEVVMNICKVFHYDIGDDSEIHSSSNSSSNLLIFTSSRASFCSSSSFH